MLLSVRTPVIDSQELMQMQFFAKVAAFQQLLYINSQSNNYYADAELDAENSHQQVAAFLGTVYGRYRNQ